MTDKPEAPLPPPQARTPIRDAQQFLDEYERKFRKNRKRNMQWRDIAEMLEVYALAESAPTSHQGLVEKARKFVHAMDRKPHSSGPTRAATWMLEYATGDTRMDIYELLVAFVESIDGAGAERGVPLEEK